MKKYGMIVILGIVGNIFISLYGLNIPELEEFEKQFDKGHGASQAKAAEAAIELPVTAEIDSVNVYKNQARKPIGTKKRYLLSHLRMVSS